MLQDEEAEFIILSPDSKGLPKERVRVNFSKEKYNRKTDDEIENLIEKTWQKRLEANPSIFNGSKFRLHQINKEIVSKEENLQVPILCIGLTSYKDYLGTNCGEKVKELQSKGLKMYENAQAYMSDAIGVGAFVITSDEKFVFLKRSELCSEAQGLLDGPGGHAEPEMIDGIFTLPSEAISLELIIHELFDSIIREVIDEVNIPRTELQEPKLIGITKNFTTGGRMSAEFLIRCRLSSNEVEKLFNEGTQSEADESTAILFRTQEEIFAAQKTCDIWRQFAPAARASFLMYTQLQNDEIKNL